ncbi:LPS export ABC transporter permease LptF [Caenispirillum bisanense]|uniref:LPS export ABC transporter permease LptF n=1 Tax=Caenispirillum bisanense TaxID=414052 RepID=UPI0031E20AD6
MRLITRYILRQVVLGTLLVSAGLAVILWLSQSLRLVEMIISKGLGLGMFVKMTMLLMPSFLVIVFPIALFAVILFTYNRLNGDRELVVMRAVGLGPFGLAMPALVVGLALTLLCYALTLYISPMSVGAFREMRWQVRNDLTQVLVQEGAFTEIETGMTVYVRQRGPNDELLGILIHDNRDPARPVTVMADRGALLNAPEGPRVLMENGNRQEVEVGTGRMSLLYFDRHVMELGKTGEQTAPRFRDARERMTGELLATTTENSGLDPENVRKFHVEAHQRLASPLFNLTFALMAAAAVLTGSFNRRGNGRRILVAIGAMVAVQVIGLAAINGAAASELLMPLIYATAIVPGMIAIAILFRATTVTAGPRATAAVTGEG